MGGPESRGRQARDLLYRLGRWRSSSYDHTHNAPEIDAATAAAEQIDEHPRWPARATIAFADGTATIEAVGETTIENMAGRHAAYKALAVLRVRAPKLADSLDRRQAKSAEKRRRRRRAAERRVARQAEASAAA